MEVEKQSELDEKTELDSGSRIEYGTSFNQNDGRERPDEISSENALDLRPEFCRYRDEGCELAESCLNCPFSKCIYDEPGGKQRWKLRLRAKEIERLHIDEGKKVKELATMFGISQRTVQRALKTARTCPTEIRSIAPHPEILRRPDRSEDGIGTTPE